MFWGGDGHPGLAINDTSLSANPLRTVSGTIDPIHVTAIDGFLSLFFIKELLHWRMSSGLIFGDFDERFLESAKPGLVILPLLKCVAKNRPANLFGARRRHRALVLPEAQASGLER